jgi:hypothetical protein
MAYNGPWISSPACGSFVRVAQLQGLNLNPNLKATIAVTFIYHGRIFDFGLFHIDFGIKKNRAVFEPTHYCPVNSIEIR